jgi:hypothetical protein
MNKFNFSVLLLLIFSLLGSATAQSLSKEEKKKVKSQLKAYMKDPDAYQKMIDGYKEEIDSDQSQIARRKSVIDQLTRQSAEYQKKMMDAENDLNQCQKKPTPECPVYPVPGEVPTEVTVYKVQIGTFKKKDLSHYFVEPKYIGLEKAAEGNNYVISYFRDREEASKFAADLNRLGLKGAFVATYENGERAVKAKKPAKK